MQDWMYLTRSWELKLISHLANSLKNQIWPKVLEAELMIGSAIDRLLNMWLQFDIDPITDSKCSFLAIFICLIFHPLLSPTQIMLNVLKHSIARFHPVI